MENKPRPVLYVITLRNKAGSNHREQLEPHKAWVSKHAAAGRILFGGSFDVRSEGGMIVARAESRAALDRMLSEDPYLVHGITTHDVAWFNVALGSLVHTLAS
jgi:uncharacterized protein YciI